MDSNNVRIFDSTSTPIPFAATVSQNIDAFLRVATAPDIASIGRVSTFDTLSAGGTGEKVAWTVTFDQEVENVVANDFEAIDEDGNTIARGSDSTIEIDDTSAPTYIVTATLPTTGYDDEDEQIGLRIGNNNIMGAMGATSTDDLTLRSLGFGTARRITTDSSDQFLLNTDD